MIEIGYEIQFWMLGSMDQGSELVGFLVFVWEWVERCSCFFRVERSWLGWVLLLK
jgi:hypothetical protein